MSERVKEVLVVCPACGQVQRIKEYQMSWRCKRCYRDVFLNADKQWEYIPKQVRDPFLAFFGDE